MENLYRPVSGAAAALAGWFAPIVPLVACVFGFIAVDFLTGVAASRAVARREGRPWWFESAEAWRTVQKLALVATGIVMAWAVDRHVLDFMDLHAARLFTGFACGVGAAVWVGAAVGASADAAGRSAGAHPSRRPASRAALLTV